MIPLVTLRRRRLLSQRALAKLAGVTEQTVVAVERHKAVPSLRTIAKLTAALGVEPGAVTEFARALEGEAEPREAAA